LARARAYRKLKCHVKTGRRRMTKSLCKKIIEPLSSIHAPLVSPKARIWNAHFVCFWFMDAEKIASGIECDDLIAGLSEEMYESSTLTL
jgi:hypothetical protein